LEKVLAKFTEPFEKIDFFTILSVFYAFLPYRYDCKQTLLWSFCIVTPLRMICPRYMTPLPSSLWQCSCESGRAIPLDGGQHAGWTDSCTFLYCLVVATSRFAQVDHTAVNYCLRIRSSTETGQQSEW